MIGTIGMIAHATVINTVDLSILGVIGVGFAVILIKLLLIPFPPKNLLNDRIAIHEIIFSSILLFSFFITWFSWGLGTIFSSSFSASGYDIPSKIKQLLTIEDFQEESFNTFLFYASSVVYLIPIFSIATILYSLLKQNKTANKTARVASLIPFFCLKKLKNNNSVLGTNNDTNGYLQYIDFGFYLMILSGISLWVSSLRTSKMANRRYTLNNQPSQNTFNDIDKPALLSQLEKLHSLKEKGVITEDIYEQERQNILNQLKKTKLKDEPEQIELIEQIAVVEEFDPEYEEHLNEQTWFKRNKTWVITYTVIGLILIGTYFYKATQNNPSSEWIFDKVSGTFLKFKNGKEFDTGLFNLKYMGQINNDSKYPFLIFSGRDCEECDENISIYIHSPSDTSSTSAKRFGFPGTERDFESNKPVYKARAFYGQVLPGIKGIIWYQRWLMSDSSWQKSVFLVNLNDNEKKETNFKDYQKIKVTLQLLKQDSCKEIKGMNYTSEP